MNTRDVPVLCHLLEGGFLGVWGRGTAFWAVCLGIVYPRHDFCYDSRRLFCHAAIIEHVRDGSVVRALLLPDYYLVTVMLSGIKVRSYIGLQGGDRVCGSVQ